MKDRPKQKNGMDSAIYVMKYWDYMTRGKRPLKRKKVLWLNNVFSENVDPSLYPMVHPEHVYTLTAWVYDVVVDAYLNLLKLSEWDI